MTNQTHSTDTELLALVDTRTIEDLPPVIGECWLYAKCRSFDQYAKYAGVGLYRLAYEMEHGEIPEELVPDHLCNTPACFNPDHIEPVTPRENFVRHYIRNYSVVCKNGHARERTGVIQRGDTQRYMKVCLDCRSEANARYWKKKRKSQPDLSQKSKTHCPQGHEYSEENTYISSNGWRICRTCHRQRIKDREARIRQSKEPKRG